jgi:hypothetical protein
LVAARSRQAVPVTASDADVLPSSYILTTLLEMGLNPIGQPIRRGAYYVLHAYDARGFEVRVVADAQFGDILAIAPVRPLVPQYERGPRIIHVPQLGDRDEPATGNDDDGAQAAPPRPRATPKPRQRSDGPPPPPPTQRRAVLSAPPPSVDKGLSPIYPTPRFKAAAESGEKFAPPKQQEVTASTPPVDNAPPAAAPQSDTPPPPSEPAQPSDQTDNSR